MCLYPKLIKNRKYIANKKNGGNIPAVLDNRVLMVPVGCQKCIECKKKKSREWQVRLTEEIKHDKTGKYITFTFNTKSLKELSEEIEGLEGYNRENAIATLAVRRFLERWRKEYKKSVKHWFVTELGQNNTEHIHIHGIMWTKVSKEEINNKWQYGFTTIMDETNGGWVNEQTINYIVKYVNKVDELHKEYNSRILTSPGIGKKYTERFDAKRNKYKEDSTKESYTNRQGFEMMLPIYYRNKIYTEEEREKLWIEKLDKAERWVCGEKIDVSKGDKEYYKLLEYHRVRNKRLGYGDDAKNWEQKKYENERRNLIFKTRIEKIEELKIVRKEELKQPAETNEEFKIPMMNNTDNIW